MALTFDRSKPGVWVSSAVHVALLAAALVAFTDRLPEAEEGIPVEIVSDSELAQMTRGERTAKEVQPDPKPRVDRKSEVVEEKDPGEAERETPAPPQRPPEMKVAEAEEAAPPPPLRPALNTPEPPPPSPPQRPAQAQAQPVPEPPKRPEPQPPKREELAKLIEREDAELAAADAKREAQAKARAEADAKAKAEAEAKVKAKAEADAKAKAEADAKAKAEAKALAQAKAKAEAEAKAKRQAELASKFNAGDIRQLLASKAPSQSSGSTGREVQRTASLGTATGTAQKLNPSQREGLASLLQSQIERCYVAPAGAAGSKATVPVLNIQFNADGTLAGEPRVVRAGAGAIDRSVADAALRAVRRCAPYRIPAQYAPFYNDWKNTTAQFELPQA